MKWFNEISEEGKMLIYMLSGLFLLPIALSITQVTKTSQDHEFELEKAAIEAGLHQEVVDGEVVWTK